jgi:hypothetical protein
MDLGVRASFILLCVVGVFVGGILCSVNNSALKLINSQFFLFFFEAYGWGSFLSRLIKRASYEIATTSLSRQ